MRGSRRLTCRNFPATSILVRALLHLPFAHGIQSEQGQEPAEVIATPAAVAHELVLAEDQRDRQSQRVKRNGNEGFQEKYYPPPRELQAVASPQKRPAEHVAAGLAIGRNGFERHAFITPHKHMAALGHAHEEILVFAASAELFAEWRFPGRNDRTPEKKIPGAAVVPVHDRSRGMFGSFTETAADNPCRRRRVKMRPHRSKDSSDVANLSGSPKVKQPVRGREFVFIEKRDIVAVCLLDA